MSPRKSRYVTPEWIAKSIKDKRKKLLFGFYDCPKCGDNKLGIHVDKQKKEAIAICVCGLRNPLKYVESYERIDYYNKLIDQFYNKK